MKTVFDTRQCVHVWAQQTQPHGRAGNVRFEGDTLYSYRMPIARILPGVLNADSVALISSLAPTVTTKRHVSEARGATRHMRSFMVPDLGESGNMALAHERNRAALIAQTEECLAALGNFRGTRFPPKVTARYGLRYNFSHDEHGHISALTVLTADNAAIRYCEIFGLEKPVFDQVAHVERIEKAWLEWTTPAKLAAREKRREQAKEREIERAAQTRKALSILADEWRAGGNFYGRFRDLPVMLRIKPDGKGDTLETSQGAAVPLVDAVKAFKMALMCRERGIPGYPPERDRRVGKFTVDRIDADGTIHAGCHTIPWAESERLAQALGIIPTEAQEPMEASHPHS